MGASRQLGRRVRAALRRTRALPRVSEETHAATAQVSQQSEATARLAAELRETTAALARDAAAWAARTEAIAADVHATQASQSELIDEIRGLREQLAELRATAVEGIEAAVDDEPATRRLLRSARSQPDYEAAWTAPQPLVSIVVPTYDQWHDLEHRSLPSALAQDHSLIEVVVVGDGAPPAIEAAVARVDDPRVRYENLPQRGPYPDDPRRRWFVAGTAAFNRAIELARGDWFVVLNDDDALRPDHVSRLLAVARESGAEVAYGKFVQHEPDGRSVELGADPPGQHRFAWQGALQHHAMRLFEWELAAATFGRPGDWDRVRRMRRAGVRFAYLDEVVCDYFPGTLWREAR